jgi:mannose-6-phosphate isomerase-like protein (cupin superfamily)
MQDIVRKCAVVAAILALLGGSDLSAQPTPTSPPAAGGGRGPAQTWWSYKTKGGVYATPMRPLWKLSDLKKMHAGQNNWQEQIIRNAQQEATYNSAAPGTHFGRRMHTDTETLFVVTGGEIHFTIEGQPPVVATRGSIVHVMDGTIFSYDIAGSQNALWVEVEPADYKVVYPGDDPAPPVQPGADVVKVSFTHMPGAYTPPNLVHWNLFEALAACAPTGMKAHGDHVYASAISGFANPTDPQNKCPAGGRGGRGGRGGATASEAFNPNSTFGHMYAGMAEWWVVQSGHIDARIENTGLFRAEEGDVLYAPPMTWHQLDFAGDGPSERLAITPYPFNNMNNTANSGE